MSDTQRYHGQIQSRIRSFKREGGTIEASIAFDNVLVSVDESDLKAFREAIVLLIAQANNALSSGGGRGFIMAPAEITKQSGSDWKVICWISKKNCFGLRYQSIYWEVSPKEMDEVLSMVDDALGMKIIH